MMFVKTLQGEQQLQRASNWKEGEVQRAPITETLTETGGEAAGAEVGGNGSSTCGNFSVFLLRVNLLHVTDT